MGVKSAYRCWWASAFMTGLTGQPAVGVRRVNSGVGLVRREKAKNSSGSKRHTLSKTFFSSSKKFFSSSK